MYSYFIWVLFFASIILMGYGIRGFIVYIIEKRKKKKEPPAKVGDYITSYYGRTYKILMIQNSGAVFKDMQTGKTITLNMKQLQSFFDGSGGY